MTEKEKTMDSNEEHIAEILSSEEAQSEDIKNDKSSLNEKIIIEKCEWEKLQEELKEYKEKSLRILAESENIRKRLIKEKMDMQAYAKENLACEFLVPIDHFENALKFKEEQAVEVKNWMIGFEMILAQFKDVLSQNDIRSIDAIGAHFDPHFHEAVEMEPTADYPPHTVIHEYTKGYRMGDRVIRPAKVKVAKAIDG